MSDSCAVACEETTIRLPATVHFSNPQEFVAELHRDKAWVHRGIVRMTRTYRPTERGVCQELAIVAGYLVSAGERTWQLIELRVPCGLVRGLEADREAEAFAEQTIGALEQAIADARLEFRPGQLAAAAERAALSVPPAAIARAGRPS